MEKESFLDEISRSLNLSAAVKQNAYKTYTEINKNTILQVSYFYYA